MLRSERPVASAFLGQGETGDDRRKECQGAMSVVVVHVCRFSSLRCINAFNASKMPLSVGFSKGFPTMVNVAREPSKTHPAPAVSRRLLDLVAPNNTSDKCTNDASIFSTKLGGGCGREHLQIRYGFCGDLEEFCS